jgi:hypothetical protein
MIKYVKEKPDGYKRTQKVNCQVCRSENLHLLEIGYYFCSSCELEVCIPCVESKNETQENINQRAIMCDGSHIMNWKCIGNLGNDDGIVTDFTCVDCSNKRLNYRDGFYFCFTCYLS